MNTINSNSLGTYWIGEPADAGAIDSANEKPMGERRKAVKYG